MYHATAEELLPVLASQVSIHVTQGPVPVDVRDVQLAEVGQERVGEGASLMEEAVRALGHPITDRQVALLLTDGEQRVGQLNCPIREQGGDQRQLSAVDVPHGADVEDKRTCVGPERALIRGKAGLDHGVVKRGREYRLPGGISGLDLHLAEVRLPGPGRLAAPCLERGMSRWAIGVQVLPRLLNAAQGETESKLEHLTR
jgi:hypothetical protein